jgi:hypothetical protein
MSSAATAVCQCTGCGAILSQTGPNWYAALIDYYLAFDLDFQQSTAVVLNMSLSTSQRQL